MLNHQNMALYVKYKRICIINRRSVYGHYTHSEIAILLGLSIGIDSASISVSGASKTTEMTDTGVTFTF